MHIHPRCCTGCRIREDQRYGERILSYSLTAGGAVLAEGRAVGNNRIALMPSGSAQRGQITLLIHTTSADLEPVVAEFAAFRSCPSR